MKNRSRLDIIVTILDTAINGSSRTKIVYNAYLSNAQLKEYLSILIAKGLLGQIDENVYKRTKKGMKFMKLCHDTDRLVGPTQELKI